MSSLRLRVCLSVCDCGSECVASRLPSRSSPERSEQHGRKATRRTNAQGRERVPADGNRGEEHPHSRFFFLDKSYVWHCLYSPYIWYTYSHVNTAEDFLVSRDLALHPSSLATSSLCHATDNFIYSVCVCVWACTCVFLFCFPLPLS